MPLRPRTTATPLGLLCAGLLLFTTFVACTTALPAEMDAEAWREDLHYLARELPARHGNAYHRVPRRDFETAVARLDERIPRLADHQVAVEMGRIVAMVGDGHTELWLNQPATGFRRLPLAFSYFRGDLYVYAAAAGHEAAVGRRVTAVGGVPIDRAHRRIAELIARDNDYEFLRSVPIYLAFPKILHAVGLSDRLDAAALTLDGPQGGEEVTFTALPSLDGVTWAGAFELAGSTPPLYLEERDEDYWFEYLEESRTVYVRYDRCKDQPGQPSIRRFARRLFAFVDNHPVERLIVDLRHNTGGNFHRNRPLIDGIRERPAIDRRGRLFVLTSRTTFSAATLAAIDLKQETAAILVGEPSRGRPNGYSDEKHLRLPNSRLVVNYSPLYRAAMPELGDAPFLPVDVAVDNGFEDYRDGRDRVLEAALSWPAGGRDMLTARGGSDD